LSKLTPEQSYYVWLFLQRGMLRQDPGAEARGQRLHAALQDEMPGMPAWSGLGWHELPTEVRAMWTHAAEAASGGAVRADA
jgi:hypothetical protein